MYDAPSEIQRAIGFLDEHPHIQGPDSHYVLISDSKDIAARWVGSSFDEWNTNECLRWLFPEYLWPNPNRPDYGVWSRAAYTLPGRENKSDPNPYLRPAGLASRERGGRASGLFIDDIVGGDDYQEHLTEGELQRRWNYVTSVPQLLKNLDPDSPQGGFILITGNRLALDDVNSRVHDEMSRFSIWHRAAFTCVVHGHGNCGRQKSDEETDCAPTQESLWTERYPDAESLARVAETITQERFDCEWMNDPKRKSDLDASRAHPFYMEVRAVSIAGESRARREWCVVVPEGDGQPEEVIPLRAFSKHVISIDPASSKKPTGSRTAVSWIALDGPTRRRFWLDCDMGRWKPGEAVPHMATMYKTARERLGPDGPLTVMCEKVANQEYVSYALTVQLKAEGHKVPKIKDEPVPRGLSKEDKNRRRIGNLLENDLLYVRAGLQGPRQEMRHFPTGKMDALDTLSQAESIFQESYGTVDEDKLRRRRHARRQARLARANSAGVPL